jgi:outer membrane protein OmpA-like peptidoglycan-associated protein
MPSISTQTRTRFAGLILAVAGACCLNVGDVRAEQAHSPRQIIDALKPPQARARSLTTTPPADTNRRPEDANFVNTLRNRPSRSLTTDERIKLATIAKEKPSIDLEINFEYNSDRISSAAMPQVTALGQALSSDDLKGNTFILAGHTDGKGGTTFNQGLSERRAEAVKRFLSSKFGIEAGQLVPVGYGKTQLKVQSKPTAAENRRVQVVNMAN